MCKSTDASDFAAEPGTPPSEEMDYSALSEKHRRAVEEYGRLCSWLGELPVRLIDADEQTLNDVRNEAKLAASVVNSELRPLTVELLQQVADLRQRLSHALEQLTAANQRYADVLQSESHRLGALLLGPARFLKHQCRRLLARRPPAPVPNLPLDHLTAGARSTSDASCSMSATSRGAGIRAEIQQEHAFLASTNPYDAVDNTDTSLAAFSDWVSVFHHNGRMYGSREPLVSDRLPSIDELNQLVPLDGLKILELGSLEGANTKQMIDLGAAHVTAIEVNKAFFLKSLCMRHEFRLEQARFILGDCNMLLRAEQVGFCSRYDLCLCSGLLYHMEDPLDTIDLIVKHAPAVFIWSHVASNAMLEQSRVKLKDSAGRTYEGARHLYDGSFDKLGGTGRGSIWLSPDELLRAFRDRGYHIEGLAEEHNYKGPALRFLAMRDGQ